MPDSRAIYHLISQGCQTTLRADYRPSNMLHGLKELLKHYQKHHGHEDKLLDVVCRREGNSFKLFSDFCGHEVVIGKIENPPQDFIGFYVDEFVCERLKESEVAVRLLQQVFGKEEEIFVTDWAPLASVLECRDGFSRIFIWDKEKDCITINTKEGFSLHMKGTNLIEAAAYLPHLYRQTLEKIPHIPEGVQSVEVEIENGDEFSMAASPLQIKCRLPNLYNTDHSRLGEIAREALDRALSRRL